MIVDGNDLLSGSTIECDVCIIGAGAAGITLAMELRDLPLRVALLESGTFTYEADVQSLYAGAITGRPYSDLDQTRLRLFGGSTNHYAGHFGPLDDLDYQPRKGLPHTGWPISKEELAPFYAKAHEYCQLGPRSFEPSFWDQRIPYPRPELDEETFRVCMRQESPTRFGPVYRPALEAAYLNSNVEEITPASSGDRVDEVPVQLNNGRSVRARARTFVLATGGMENARVLLNSTSVHENGLGNDHDLVGRYFMDHIAVGAGLAHLSADSAVAEYFTRHELEDVPQSGPGPHEAFGVRMFMALKPEVTRREQLVNMVSEFIPLRVPAA